MKGSMLVPPENLEDRLERINPAVTATINWIENVLENSIKSENGFRRALITGEVLCRLLNVVSPGTVKRVNHCPNRAAAADNLTLFLSSCEDKFGVLRSRLFSVSDFEDIFEQDESPVTEIQGIKHTEKIVIALFWLAKAIEQKPDCQNVPRLDYSAFTGLLPKQTIYRTPAISTTDSESVRSKKSLSLERKSSYAGEVALEPHYFVRPQSSSTMGNAQPHSPTSKQVVSMLEKAQTLPSQTNNSALDEDEWQSDLDDWREKRRKASRLQATKMFSLEEQKQEEERKHQAAIRARMQEIKSHRTSVTSSYIPSIDIAQPPPVSSPGMALLTGAAFDLSEISDDSVLSAIAPYGTYNRSKKRDTSIDNNSVPIPNSHSAEVEEFDPKDHNTNGPSSRIHEDVFTSTVDETVQPELSATDACRSCADSPDLSDVSVAQGVHNVVIRLQSKTGATESRWGMTVKAEGPKSNAPFVVDRVKIGSSADVCDVIKGDILVQLNGVDLRKCATNDAFTLHNLEQMMDQLALSGKTTNLTVLRKVSHQDEFSEVESSEPSDGEKSTMNATSGLTEAAATSFSDFDVTVAPSTVIANVETSNISSPNANLLVASESLFVQSVLPVEIPQSDTIMRPIHRSSPIDQSTSQIKEPSREDKDKITQSPKIPLSTSHVTSLVTSLRSPLSTQS